MAKGERIQNVPTRLRTFHHYGRKNRGIGHCGDNAAQCFEVDFESEPFFGLLMEGWAKKGKSFVDRFAPKGQFVGGVRAAPPSEKALRRVRGLRWRMKRIAEK